MDPKRNPNKKGTFEGESLHFKEAAFQGEKTTPEPLNPKPLNP